jgi:hypothetical protein
MFLGEYYALLEMVVLTRTLWLRDQLASRQGLHQLSKEILRSAVAQSVELALTFHRSVTASYLSVSASAGAFGMIDDCITRMLQ